MYTTDINGLLFFVIWLIAMYIAAGFAFWIGDHLQRLESEERKASWKKSKKTLNKNNITNVQNVHNETQDNNHE